MSLWRLCGVYCAGVRQFCVKLQIELFTRDLGSQHPIRGVGHLIFREMPRPFRHSDAKGALELGQSVARRGADKEGFLEIKDRSEEHTSELQSLMRISYAVFCLKKKKH